MKAACCNPAASAQQCAPTERSNPVQMSARVSSVARRAAAACVQSAVVAAVVAVAACYAAHRSAHQIKVKAGVPLLRRGVPRRHRRFLPRQRIADSIQQQPRRPSQRTAPSAPFEPRLRVAAAAHAGAAVAAAAALDRSRQGASQHMKLDAEHHVTQDRPCFGMQGRRSEYA
eukprot:6182372-Pleurochrysis_carterae.AAC.1